MRLVFSAKSIRIAILGAGAMGSVFGGALACSKCNVTLIDLNQAHLDAILEHGLIINSDAGQKTINLTAVLPKDVEGKFDLIIVFTKSLHTRAALEAISSSITKDTVLLSLQNGLGNIEKLAEFADPDHIVFGATNLPADFKAPGSVSTHGASNTWINSAGQNEGAAENIAKLLNNAGIETVVDKTVLSRIWEKLAFNCALNSVCATIGAPVGAIAKNPQLSEVSKQIAKECYNVACAAGIEVDLAIILEKIEFAFEHHTHHKPSMLQDVEAGRMTEIDALNGAVCEVAAKHGIDAPLNGAFVALVKAIEIKFNS